MEATLRRARAEENFDFAPLLEKARGRINRHARGGVGFPTKIITDNKAHPYYTLIQIETPDRLGLLYDLLSALGEEGVSIILSRISTEKGAAIDTFYVADMVHRGKITDATRIAALQKRLQQIAVGTPSGQRLQSSAD